MCDHCGCRQFEPIAELTADHERILALAWQIASASNPGDPTLDPIRGELGQLLDVHALKEELGLYPLLIETGDLSQENCDRLEEEHRQVHHVLANHTFDRRQYFALAAHIEEEEMELFTGARFAFDEEEWAEMSAAHHDALHHFGIEHQHSDEHETTVH